MRLRDVHSIVHEGIADAHGRPMFLVIFNNRTAHHFYPWELS